MPKVTEAHQETRRRQILAAAVVSFSRNGFHQTTIQDICREAQLSPGAIYRYFSGKEDIIEAMAEEGRRRSEALIAAAREMEGAPQVLDYLADSFFGILDRPESYDQIRMDVQLWAEALRNPKILDLVQRGVAAVRDPFSNIVRRGQERGDIRSDLDPEAVARVMISLFRGLLMQKAMDTDVDVQKYLAVVKAMGGGILLARRP